VEVALSGFGDQLLRQWPDRAGPGQGGGDLLLDDEVSRQVGEELALV
jgi:hypothetical protein